MAKNKRSFEELDCNKDEDSSKKIKAKNDDTKDLIINEKSNELDEDLKTLRQILPLANQETLKLILNLWEKKINLVLDLNKRNYENETSDLKLKYKEIYKKEVKKLKVQTEDLCLMMCDLTKKNLILELKYNDLKKENKYLNNRIEALTKSNEKYLEAYEVKRRELSFMDIKIFNLKSKIIDLSIVPEDFQSVITKHENSNNLVDFVNEAGVSD